MELKRQYVTDEHNQRVAVMLDIETFERLERILEDYGLAKLMAENADETLGLEAARAYYDALEKAP